MALNINDPEAEQLAHQLANATGDSLAQAVIVALRNRLDTVQRHHEHAVLMAEISEIQALVASLPDRDVRTADEILGYDNFGLPG